MARLVALVFGALVAVSWAVDLNFPSGFQFGIASSSYQVEGGWNASDKGESIYDRYTHTRPDLIADHSTGDVACDSYHLWREDAQLAANLGVDFYRFSLSWPRILPSGFSNKVSEDGKNYYNNLIDELIKKGVKPVITLYHWDLPQKLQDLGGWTNPLIPDWFADYARVAYQLFGDRVKQWHTINEPLAVCDGAYNTNVLAPDIIDETDHAIYLCNKNILLAHAKAWRVYDEEFRAAFGGDGQVTIANHLMWFEPATDTAENEELAELAFEYCNGRYLHAIYSEEGGWPPAIEKIVAENSKKQGYARSRMPAFTEEEIQLVKGTYDLFGFNHYMSRIVRKAAEGEEVTPWPSWGMPEIGLIIENRPEWGTGSSESYSINPPGMRQLLNQLKQKYGDLEFLITEIGYGSSEYGLEDDERIEFHQKFLEQLMLSIHDGVNVTGYTAWTLLDNFEWWEGYNVKYGMHQVDFSSPERTRTPRKSAYFYADLIAAQHQAQQSTFID